MEGVLIEVLAGVLAGVLVKDFAGVLERVSAEVFLPRSSAGVAVEIFTEVVVLFSAGGFIVMFLLFPTLMLTSGQKGAILGVYRNCALGCCLVQVRGSTDACLDQHLVVWL